MSKFDKAVINAWVVIIRVRESGQWFALREMQPTQELADKFAAEYIRLNRETCDAARWHDWRGLIENLFDGA